MQCRYCGARTPASATVCPTCGKPLTKMGPSNEAAGPGRSCAVHRDYPALSRLRYGSRFRTEQNWRTRHLTGFTSSLRTSAPASGAAPPDGEPAGSGPFPDQQRSESRAGASARQHAPSQQQGSGIPPAHDAGMPASEPAMTMPLKQALQRIFIMVAVFVVGVTVGLSVARWMKRPSPATPAAIAPQSSPAPAVTRSTDPDGRRTVIRGISPGELPYDGAPPPSDEAATTQAPAISGATAAENYSGASAPEPDTMHAESVPSPKAAFSGKGRDGEKEEKPMHEETNAGASTSPVSAATARKPEKPKSGGESVRTKKRDNTRAAKDREIERIKKQADHELQRKLETSATERAASKRRLASSGRSKGHSAASVANAKTLRVRKILAKCERAPNLFRREQCKWQVCGDRWGKDGCPSYPKSASFH